MIYILDTNIFRKLLDHFPRKGATFEKIWKSLDDGIENGSYISVDECYNELTCHFNENNSNYRWLFDRRTMFQNPTNQESIFMKKLFQDNKMQDSIHSRNILENRPSADVYIVAKAKTLGATVVTCEEFKPNSAQLPNICAKTGVSCIGYDDFMAILTER